MNQEELSRRVSTIVERGIAQGQIAGACVGVYQNQEELLCEAYGLADRESGRAMQTDALFRIFSMTKPVTAVATMMLWEQGVLELRDPVHWYIPSFRDKLVEQDGALVPAQEEITIQHLLNMTSGIPYPGWGSESYYRGVKTEGKWSPIKSTMVGSLASDRCSSISARPSAECWMRDR